MTEQNPGQAKGYWPHLAAQAAKHQKAKEPPHELPFIPCDADSHCDRAICEVIVNVAKRLYFCGHHYRKHALHIFEHAYEVKEL